MAGLAGMGGVLFTLCVLTFCNVCIGNGIKLDVSGEEVVAQVGNSGQP